jgi:catechol 2,3-dioxygenase-like lactoylglutathione lyase family enzyme
MATPQLGVIGIVVADMARSLAFYRQVTELQFPCGTTPHRWKRIQRESTQID